VTRLVSIIRAFANGIEAFQSAVRPPIGFPSPTSPDHLQREVLPLDESADLFNQVTGEGPLTTENPYMDAFDALRLADILDSSVTTFQCLANASVADVFQSIRDVNLASVVMITKDAEPTLTREQMDRGLLFEIARMAHYQFHADTDADLMWAPDDHLTYHISGVGISAAQEVHSFLDAAFKGDFAGAVMVGDAFVRSAFDAYGDMGNQEVSDSLARRNLAALIMIDLSGTLSAQTMGDLVEIEGRPIAVTLADDTDDLESGGSDDE